MEPNQYYIATGLNLVAGLLWVAAAFAAFSGWRAFKQRPDLAWLGAFLALALAAFGSAMAAWQGAAVALDLTGTAALYAETVLPNDLRSGSLLLIAALLAFYAFVQRRAI